MSESKKKYVEYDRTEVFKSLTNRVLPDMFKNKVFKDIDDDLSKWDQLSRNCIRIGRAKGLYAAWEYVISQNGVNHVLITGRPYVGKTTGGLSLAKGLSEIYNALFDERNCLGGRAVVLSPELIKTQFSHIKDFTNFIIFIDEIQHAFNRMRATSEANVEANKFYDAIRKLGVHTISTAPTRGGVDRTIVDEKILWWIHCHSKDIASETVEAIVFFNACSKTGQEWDFIEVERITFKWIDSKLYFAVTDKISNQKIYSASGLESFQQGKRSLEDEGKDAIKQIIVQKIMKSNRSIERKAYRLLKEGFPVSYVQSVTQLSNTKANWVKGQIDQGIKEKDMKIKKKKGKGR